MAKILIIDTVAYEKAPYIKNYEKVFYDSGVEYEIFSWDRESKGILEKLGNRYTFHEICPFGGSKVKKVLPMVRYQKQLRKVIKEGNYSALILIDSLAPLMISNTVLSEYRGKYILDIRDYTYEKYSFYLKRLMELVRNSAFTTISSKGFLRFLKPSDKYVVTHNISNIGSNSTSIEDISKKEIINIGFVGNVRYFKENCLLLDSLRNTNYVLSYTGSATSDCDLQRYCNKKNITNIVFKDKYNNDDKPNIYKNIDVINSIYGDSSLEVTTLLPNRLYDALLFKKPILASKGTYLGEVVQNYGIGLVVDIYHDDIKAMLDKYLASYDAASVMRNMQKLLSEVLYEQDIWFKRAKEFASDYT